MSFLPNFIGNIFKKNEPVEIRTEASIGNSSFNRARVSLGSSMDNGAKWWGGLSSYVKHVFKNHSVILQNARHAYDTTIQAKAIVDRNADVVADVGLRLEAVPKAKELGITLEEAEIWASDVEEKFDSWAMSKKQHRAELMNWYQSHRLYQIMAIRDGETFPRFFYTRDVDALNKLQFEFIDQTQIRGNAFTNSLGIQTTDDGIIRDSRNRETGYKIWTQKKDGTIKMETIPKKGARSGRIFMLHGFAPEFPMQRRGFSRLSHALQEFENLTDFSSAEIKKAINQSNITMFVQPHNDFDSSQPMRKITNRRSGPASTQFGSNPSPSPSAQNVGPIVEFQLLDEATMGVPGSTGVYNLKRGETLKPMPNTSPSANYNQFVDTFCTHLSASTSTPLEVVLMKFSNNFSASRASLILFWRVAQIWRQEMATDYLNPTYTMWLSEEIAAGRVKAPGWSNPRSRAAWSNARWIGSPMPNIDPSKTSKANKDNVEMGLVDLDSLSRQENGSVGSMNRSKLAKQLQNLPPVPWGKGKTNNTNGGVPNG